MTYENHWQRRTFDSGTKRRAEHQRDKHYAAGRAIALEQAWRIAVTLEEKGGSAGIVRVALGHLLDEAHAELATLKDLDDTGPAESGRASGASTSPLGEAAAVEAGGLSERGGDPPPDTLSRVESGESPRALTDAGDAAPLSYEQWRQAVAEAYDEIMRGFGVPEPTSLKAHPLRRIK